MEKKLYIIGAGSVGGHVALNIRDYSNKYKIAGFFDDDSDKIDTKQFGHTVLGPVSDALDLKNVALIIGIAFPKIKKEIIELLSANKSLTYPALIHDKAWISNSVSIGNGSIIYPGTSVNYGSEIGDHVVINMNCAIGHHTKIEDYASLAPAVKTGGHTCLGEAADIGIGVSTLQEVMIGAGCTVGGQAMVTHNIPENETAVGIPAQVKRKQK